MVKLGLFYTEGVIKLWCLIVINNINVGPTIGDASGVSFR